MERSSEERKVKKTHAMVKCPECGKYILIKMEVVGGNK